MIRALLLGLLGLAGCSSDVLRLDPRWAPLEEVVERPSLLFGRGTSTTIGPRLYVADLCSWERRYPEGSVEREALLLHEQEHARRQLALGLGRWLGRYLNDRAFMWGEEQRGWALELRHLQSRGRTILPIVVARELSGYRNLQGRMVNTGDALVFVLDVLAGRWTPPAGGEP